MDKNALPGNGETRRISGHIYSETLATPPSSCTLCIYYYSSYNLILLLHHNRLYYRRLLRRDLFSGFRVDVESGQVSGRLVL
ncbi:unnamed protein product [Arabidopsis thaliana]|uniref:(thale cress) hypothetical protein n=1 Tax=Arabidopsis thaliana TaxID=3702 RepID=A0A7G2F2C7_ARATH|nr:unnamed protein product [Arabidopsis thaliana]